MGIITFNGISSESIFQVEHPPEYEIPERNYNIIPVPGRNGDLTMDTGSYKNVTRSYKISMGSMDEDFTVMANKIAKWLHSTSGYARLEDSYEPDFYKIAMYSDGGSIENILQHAGRVTINFNRKPQRFLKSGDTKIIIPGSQMLVNPTDRIALPVITVKGNGAGTLIIGNYRIDITNIINHIDIDSEIEDAYNGTDNLNMYITLTNGFPKLVPGGNPISFSGGITSVEVTPRWWTI